MQKQTRKSKIPSAPRFQYIRERANTILLEYGFDKLPISPYDILAECEGKIVCLSWSEAKELTKADDPFDLHKNSAEGRTIAKRNTGIYIIVYDDVNITNADRIRWTIMHELGHIFLGHLDEFENTALNRGGLTGEEYGILEVEAHQFAAEVFAPLGLFMHLKDVSVQDIQLICDISKNAAQKRHNLLYTNNYRFTNKDDQSVYRNFSHFIRWDIDDALFSGVIKNMDRPSCIGYDVLARKCPQCHSITTEENDKYCMYCGSSFTIDTKGLSWFQAMEYIDNLNKEPAPLRSTFDSLMIGRAADELRICPTCHNEETSGALFCKICGSPLQNICPHCHTLQSTAARFCSNCGAELPLNESYLQADSYLQSIRCIKVNPEWIEYPYWDYVASALYNVPALFHAMQFSVAFEDDNYGLHIITANNSFANIINNFSDTLLKAINEASTTERTYVEVMVLNDI